MGIRVVYVGQSEAFWRPRPVFTSMPPLRSIERGGFISSFIRSSIRSAGLRHPRTGYRDRPAADGIAASRVAARRFGYSTRDVLGRSETPRELNVEVYSFDNRSLIPTVPNVL